MSVDVIFASLLNLLTSPELLLLLLAAIPIGMFFGAIPGLGGKLGIALMIPFVFGMEPLAGAVFLLAMHAVVHTGGSIPSILLGIPGTGPDAATVVDGYPMAQKGEAGRALGASLGASAFGGLIGALVLALLLPVLQPIVLLFGPAEFFWLAILGITTIAALSGDSLLKGLIVGCFGLMLAFVGLRHRAACRCCAARRTAARRRACTHRSRRSRSTERRRAGRRPRSRPRRAPAPPPRRRSRGPG